MDEVIGVTSACVCGDTERVSFKRRVTERDKMTYPRREPESKMWRAHGAVQQAKARDVGLSPLFLFIVDREVERDGHS
jgi:hypothetical protein